MRFHTGTSDAHKDAQIPWSPPGSWKIIKSEVKNVIFYLNYTDPDTWR